MAQAQPLTSSVGIETRKVRYKIPKDLQKEENMSFKIEPAADGQSQGVFQIKDETGSVVAQKVSEPFPSGILIMKREGFFDKKSGSYVVKLKKTRDDVDLKKFFG